MNAMEIVCLCDTHDLKRFFAAAFEATHPWLRLVNPDEVSDPLAINHAFAFSPGKDAFVPYPNLRMISSAGAGIDVLLGHPGVAQDVVISRVKLEEQAEMIAAFAMWHIIDWQRKISDYPALQKRKEWAPINRTAPTEFPVGVLGYGLIGGTLARRLHDLKYPVLAYGSKPRHDDGIEIASGADGLKRIANSCRAIVNLLPLTDETTGILSSELFAEMRDDALIINLGRGSHLVEPDLIAALEKGRPAGAALDVFAVEPLPQSHPFWEHDKIRITPHIAGYAEPSSVVRFVAEGIAAFERGAQPEGIVDRSRGY
jgi:glyoxylate/hydroxypyruvate reductase A